GVIYTVREAMKALGLPIEKTTASVQGFGNVAQYAIRLYNQLGGKVICVSSWDQKEQTSFSFLKTDGIDPDALLKITDRFGGIDKDQAREIGYEILPGEDWIKQEVDLLVPAALENQITAKTVDLIRPRVKIVAEGANGPTTPDADKVLEERGVFVIPDFLANAGGVTCSYFEQVQSNMNFYWEKELVLERLDNKMTSAFHAVHELATKKKLFMRDAAYFIAVSRVAEACRSRGWV
ncbi:MAG: glutamate dehydrogenase, partial [Planctomycetes bacterium]|nr:glutamate dehydrogenase [Planctomycetota bacterium]